MLVTSTRQNRQGAPLGARKMVQVAPRQAQAFGGNPRIFRGSKCTLKRVRIAPFVVYFTPRFSRGFAVSCGATALRLAAYRVHVNIRLRRRPVFLRHVPEIPRYLAISWASAPSGDGAKQAQNRLIFAACSVLGSK